MRGLLLTCSALLLVASGVPAGSGQSPPVPVSGNPRPAHPPAALEARVDGEVRFSLRVDAAGRVESVRILEVPRAGLGFEAAAEAALEAWRFEPATWDGVAVPGLYDGRLAMWSTFDAARVRLFAADSKRAWSELLAMLGSSGFADGTRDDGGQVVVARSRSLRRFTRETGLELDAGFAPETIRISAFVSPFVEPARVYVGSVIEAEDAAGRFRTYYNRPEIGVWILEELGRRLDARGFLLPRDLGARLRLAGELLGTPAPPCLEAALQSAEPESWDRMVPHEPIEASVLKPAYPVRRRGRAEPARVILSSALLEDGALSGEARVLFSDNDEPQFSTAATQAASLWRYRPPVLDDCPVPIDPFNIKVEFASRKRSGRKK